MKTFEEALNLWKTMGLRDWAIRAADDAVSIMMPSWARYQDVEIRTRVPAHVVACIHYRETSLNFERHLANGDPLFRNGKPAKTVNVPAGLGPFENWESSAVGVFQYMSWQNLDWSLPKALLHLQRYNGLGYLRRGMNSPYIWSGSLHYDKGKFWKDGQFRSDLVDKQVGCAVLLESMKRHGIDVGDKWV